MKSTLISLALLSLFFTISAAYGAGILVLDQNNFDQVLSQVKYVLVEFYIPDCSSCNRFTQEYAKAAQQLAFHTPRIKFFEVDASTEKGLVERYNIQNFPTTMLFISGRPVEYEGIWDTDELINWIERKIDSVSIKISSLEEIGKYVIPSSYLVGVFFGDENSEAHREYLKVAKSFDDMVFLETDSEELRKHFRLEKDRPAFILFKNFDERKGVFSGEEFTYETLYRFIQVEKYPAVSLFNEATERRIFREGQDAIFLILNHESLEKAEELQEIFMELAFERKGEFVMTILDFERDISIEFTELLSIPLNHLLQVERSDLPTLRLLEPKHGMRVYSLSGEMTIENLRKFIDDFHNRRIEPFQSYLIPEIVS